VISLSQTQLLRSDSPSLKERMEKLANAILLKRLLSATNLDGIDNVSVQELLDKIK
jgi:hypothetical protein